MSAYSTVLNIPLTVTGADKETAIARLEEVLAELDLSARTHGATAGPAHIDRLRPVPATGR